MRARGVRMAHARATGLRHRRSGTRGAADPTQTAREKPLPRGARPAHAAPPAKAGQQSVWHDTAAGAAGAPRADARGADRCTFVVAAGCGAEPLTMVVVRAPTAQWRPRAARAQTDRRHSCAAATPGAARPNLPTQRSAGS
jgi:hypothetical protein